MNDPWHRIEGSVRGPDDQPVAEAFVSIAKASVVLPEIVQMATRDGTFAMMLPAGEFTLKAWSADGALTGEQRFQVPRDLHPRIVLHPAPSS